MPYSNVRSLLLTTENIQFSLSNKMMDIPNVAEDGMITNTGSTDNQMNAIIKGLVDLSPIKSTESRPKVRECGIILFEILAYS